MLSVTSASVNFVTPFTQEITVFSQTVDAETGSTTDIPSTSIPVVTASFIDPGVVITKEIGKVTISGMYKEIFVTTWQYIDTTGAIVSTLTVPELGTFRKITKVDSPPNLTEVCTYTIDGESFVHTVSLPSYTIIADTLKSLLATIP
jgi:hypothetical protein